MRAMVEYRVFLLAAKGAIEARHEFVADDEASALLIARCLFDACSDSCAGYELWSGRNRLAKFLPGAATGRPIDGELLTLALRKIW